MFGLSIELITKGKLATGKRLRCWCFERQPFLIRSDNCVVDDWIKKC